MIEKEEVNRLRSHINHLEIERAELIHRLALTEDGVAEVARRNENISGQMSTREKQALIIDSDNRDLSDRVRRLTL
jgi:hypothetical protein